jgi:hypothetical protein
MRALAALLAVLPVSAQELKEQGQGHFTRQNDTLPNDYWVSGARGGSKSGVVIRDEMTPAARKELIQDELEAALERLRAAAVEEEELETHCAELRLEAVRKTHKMRRDFEKTLASEKTRLLDRVKSLPPGERVGAFAKLEQGVDARRSKLDADIAAVLAEAIAEDRRLREAFWELRKKNPSGPAPSGGGR